VRLHQEDFCQALGIPPEWKYQNERGPSLVECFALVRTASSRPSKDLARLLDYVIFNFLVGNTDAHGKNFSLLYYPDRRTELAPLYDVVSTLPYPEIEQRMAMKIGGKYEPAAVFVRHWDRLADAVGFAKPLVRRRVVEMTTAIKIPFDDTKRLVRPYSPAFVDSLTDLIDERIETTRERFTKATSGIR
jgi:serine/threonine-protein kinase HipA